MAVLVAADAVLKAVWHVPSDYLKKIIRYDPSLEPHKRLKPLLDLWLNGAYNEFRFRLTTDDEGFRRTAPGEPASEKSCEALFLGDSQTVGVGVNDPDTIPSLVAAKLGKNVLNTACYGYSNREELALYRSAAFSHPARWTILCFFAGNDPYENFKQRKKEGFPSKPARAGMLENAKRFLKQRSSIYNLLDRFRRQRWFNAALESSGAVKDRIPGELLIFKKDSSAGPIWETTDKTLSTLSDEVARNGSRFLIVFIPDRYQVDRDYWNQWVEKYRFHPDDFDLSAPNHHLRAFCNEKEIDFLDTTVFLKEASQAGSRVYWSVDSHLNLAGNRLIAEALSDYLKNHEEGRKI
ncbi:MAG: hypothetical protein HYZ52_04840 [Candidatus Omnitrophica bacterium]|nr:hypothetical protein [Candidatus Omnitrophota bacterium]